MGQGMVGVQQVLEGEQDGGGLGPASPLGSTLPSLSPPVPPKEPRLSQQSMAVFPWHPGQPVQELRGDSWIGSYRQDRALLRRVPSAPAPRLSPWRGGLFASHKVQGGYGRLGHLSGQASAWQQPP